MNTTLRMVYAPTGGWNGGEEKRDGRRENDCMFVLFLFCLTFLVIVVGFVEWYTLLGRGLVLLRGEWL